MRIKGLFVRIFLASIIAIVYLDAAVYYAKVEPKERYIIKAATSGAIKEAAISKEGKVLKESVIVQLDDALNRVEMERSIQKLASLKSMRQATKENIANLEAIADVNEKQYERIKDLKTKSQIAKEAEYISLINAKNQVVSARSSLHNLENQITDITFKIESLEDTITKKRIKVEKGLLYSLHVKPDDYVNIGAVLAEVHDISEGKLTVFLSLEDKLLMDKKMLYLDDEPLQAVEYKVWPVADANHISSYKTEIHIQAPKTFSKLVKVEWK